MDSEVTCTCEWPYYDGWYWLWWWAPAFAFLYLLGFIIGTMYFVQGQKSPKQYTARLALYIVGFFFTLPWYVMPLISGS